MDRPGMQGYFRQYTEQEVGLPAGPYVAGRMPPQRTYKSSGTAGFVLVTLFLIFEYIRPQSLLPSLQVLHLPRVVTVLTILLWLMKGDKTIVGSRPVVLFGLFLGLTAGSVVYAVNTYCVYENTILLVSYFMAAVLPMASFVGEAERFKPFLKIWICVQLVVALFALSDGGMGAGGFLKDENDLALVASAAVPYAYFLAQSKERNRWGKLFCYITLLTLIGAVVVSFSRGGFVALLAAIVAIIAYSKKRLRLIVVVVLALAIGSGIVGVAYKKEMDTITDPHESTAADRLYLWARAWDMFLDNPVLGVGSGNYPWRVVDYEHNIPLRDGHVHGGRVAHSLYFTLLPEYGVVGVAIYGMLVISLFRASRRSRKALEGDPELSGGDLDMASRAVPASLFGFFAGATFIAVLYYPVFWVTIGISLALEGAVGTRLGRQSNMGEASSRTVKSESYPT